MTLTDLNREADARQPNRRLANRPIDFCITGIERGENRYGAFFCLTIRAADANEEEHLFLSATAKRERRFAVYRQHLPLHGVRLLHTGPGRGVYDLIDGKGCACRGAGRPAGQPTEMQRDGGATRGPAPVQEEPVSSPADDRPAEEQQLRAIRKLCLALGREEPDEPLTFTSAGALIRQLSADHNATRRRAG